MPVSPQPVELSPSHTGVAIEDLIHDGHIYLVRNDLEQATWCFQTALQSVPDLKEGHHGLGLVALKQCRYAEAAVYFIQALSQDQGYRPAFRGLWQAYAALGRLEEITPLLDALCLQHPDDAEYHALRAQLPSAPAADEASAAPDEQPERIWTFPEEAFAPDLPTRAHTLLDEASAQIRAGLLDTAETTLHRYLKSVSYTNLEAANVLASLYQRRQDIPAIKELWKRMAVAALTRGEVDAFFMFYELSVYSEHRYSPRHTYAHATVDEDFHAYIKLLAAIHPLRAWVQQHRRPRTYQRGRDRLKIGFLLNGFSQTQAPPRTYFPLAEHHDPNRFELHFYSPISLQEPVALKENYATSVAFFESFGCNVWYPAQRGLRPTQLAEAMARRIVEDEIDILFFQSTYLVPIFNFLAHLGLAPFQAGNEHQQPEHASVLNLLFTPRKTSLESRCAVAPPLISMTRRPDEAPRSRSEFGIPEGATVLTSLNRTPKYRHELFWREMGALLERHLDTYFLAIGLEALPDCVPLDASYRDRVVTPGFRRDVVACLGAADIYVDLFPSGGGSSVIEAMQVGLPVVCFEQDFTTPYKTNGETVGSSFVAEPALLVPPRQYPRWHQLMDRLIEDTALRAEMSERMRQRAQDFDPCVVSDRFFDTIETHFYETLAHSQAH